MSMPSTLKEVPVTKGIELPIRQKVQKTPTIIIWLDSVPWKIHVIETTSKWSALKIVIGLNLKEGNNHLSLSLVV